MNQQQPPKPNLVQANTPPPPPKPNLPQTSPTPPLAANQVLANQAPANSPSTNAGAPTVVVDRVSKWFGGLVAVNDVSFTVSQGVIALLGPNGAGKSTLLRMLAGLAKPSSGSVRILGGDPRKNAAVSAEIGMAPQQESVFSHLTAFDFVAASAQLQGVEDSETAARHALSAVELDPDDSRLMPSYSKGMRQRVKLAQAIVHDPTVILLDEPLAGLDPRQRVSMVKLFHNLANQGRTVVVSSHVLEEVERFGSQVLVISNGRVAAEGDFHQIRQLMDNRPHRIKVECDKPRLLAAALIGTAGVDRVELEFPRPQARSTDVVSPYPNPTAALPPPTRMRLEPQAVVVDTQDVEILRRNIAPLAHRNDVVLRGFKPLDDDLESVFRYLVGGRQ